MSDEGRLSHLDDSGRARMVGVGEKPVTDRRAVAEGFVRVSSELAGLIREDRVGKGSLPEVARLAGIMGAKRTADLIPLCHPLGLDHVGVEVSLEGEGGASRVKITAEASCCARTGVEMEALTAVAIAALTVIDMGKAVDPGMVIEGVRLIEKSGGRRGLWRAQA